MESTVSAIQASALSRHGKAWGQTQQQASWQVEMAPSGLQTLAHLIRSRTGQSRPFAQGVAFRVIKSLHCSKTVLGTCGWVWMMDYICSRMVDSVACLNRITGRWGWWLE